MTSDINMGIKTQRREKTMRRAYRLPTPTGIQEAEKGIVPTFTTTTTTKTPGNL